MSKNFVGRLAGTGETASRTVKFEDESGTLACFVSPEDFPSSSPFLRFRVAAEPIGALWKLVRVDGVSPVPVSRDAFVNSVAERSEPNRSEIATVLERELAGVAHCRSNRSCAYPRRCECACGDCRRWIVLPRDRDALEGRYSGALEWAEDAWLSKRLLRLMRTFSSKFLRGLSDDQISVLEKLSLPTDEISVSEALDVEPGTVKFVARDPAVDVSRDIGPSDSIGTLRERMRSIAKVEIVSSTDLFERAEWNEGKTVLSALPAFSSSLNRAGNPKSLVICFANKLSPRSLLRELRDFPHLEELVLFGDANELGPHRRSGGGDLFLEMFRVLPGRTIPSNNVTSALVDRKRARFPIDYLNVRSIPTSYRHSTIACTNERSAREIAKVVGSKIKVHRRIAHLPSMVVGEITDAYLAGSFAFGASGSDAKISRKASLILGVQDYVVEIEGRRYRLNSDVVNAEVTTLSRWCGPKVERLVVYVDDYGTSIQEIAGMMKYAERFEVIMRPGLDLSMLPFKRTGASTGFE